MHGGESKADSGKLYKDTDLVRRLGMGISGQASAGVILAQIRAMCFNYNRQREEMLHNEERIK